jgi:putative FmdB family regulatory protein
VAIYVYRCETCGMTFERRQSIGARPPAACPECDGPVCRLIQPVGIVFKGSGFYVNDSKRSAPASDK